MRRDEQDRGGDAVLSWRGQLLVAFGMPLLSMLFCLLVLEIVLRFMPVASGLASMPVDQAHPIFHFTPDRPYVYSRGWDMHRVRRGRSNNMGWIDDQDYRRDDPTPLLAIIGDSFIEGLMVPYADTMQARLAGSLAGKLRVYSFAGSGAPLSQYLIWAGQAVKEYGARAVVINVVSNDFDESVCALKRAPGFWCYEDGPGGRLQLRLVEHHPGIGTSLIRASALARYLLINLQVMQRAWDFPWLTDWLFGIPAHAQPKYAGNTEAQAGQGSYFDLMHRAFATKAQALGYELIDLDTLFMAPERAGQRYDYPDDAHWNGNGHAVAAGVVSSSRLLAGLLQ